MARDLAAPCPTRYLDAAGASWVRVPNSWKPCGVERTRSFKRHFSASSQTRVFGSPHEPRPQNPAAPSAAQPWVVLGLLILRLKDEGSGPGTHAHPRAGIRPFGIAMRPNGWFRAATRLNRHLKRPSGQRPIILDRELTILVVGDLVSGLRECRLVVVRKYVLTELAFSPSVCSKRDRNARSVAAQPGYQSAYSGRPRIAKRYPELLFNPIPINRVLSAIEAPVIRPNVIVIGRASWSKLIQHPKIVKAASHRHAVLVLPQLEMTRKI